MNVEKALELIKDNQFESKTFFTSIDKVMILTLPNVSNIVVFDKNGEKYLIKINCSAENVIQVE